MEQTQNTDITLTDNGVAYAQFFTSNFSLLLSILIGIIATILVLRAAKKLGGGLFGSVLNYVGIGTALSVVGSLAMEFANLSPSPWLSILNGVCISTGYIFMVLGANKLLKGIINS